MNWCALRRLDRRPVESSTKRWLRGHGRDSSTRGLTRDQRGIRSSGKPIKMVDHAQGWQGKGGYDRTWAISSRSGRLCMPFWSKFSGASQDAKPVLMGGQS